MTHPQLATASSIDKGIVVLYLVLSFAVGLLASRFLSRRGKQTEAQQGLGERRPAADDSAADNEEEYYLAGRRIPGWMNGISYAITAMNADVAPTYCGFAVVVGLPIAFFYLPRFALAWMIAAMLFAIRWRQLGVRTGPEFYAIRFDKTRSRFVRVYSALFAVTVNMIPWIGAGMLGVHKIFSPLFSEIDATAASLGVEPKVVTLSIILPILVIYVWASGFAGVLITDILQSLIIVAANVILLALVLQQFGGPTGLATAIEQARPAESGEILAAWPAWGHRVLAPMVVLMWLIVPTVGRGGSVDLEGQRIFSCRSDRDAAKMNVWAVGSLFGILLLLTLPALAVIANHPEMYLAEPGIRETAYSLLLGDYLPVGLLGIALAALLASVMSTIDSHLNYGAQTLVNDVLRQIAPQASWLRPGSGSALWTGRLLMLVILGCAIIVTYNADSLIGIAITLGGMYGAVATLYWGQWWWWRVNFWSWLTAMVGGPVVYLTLGWALSQWPWWAEQAAASESAAQGMAMLQAAIGMGLTFVAWVTVTVLTKPEAADTLKHFYRVARPMGIWGPIREACLAEADADWSPPPSGLLMGGLAVAMLGATWISAAVIGLGVLCVGRYGEAAAYLGVAIVGGLGFRTAFNWHLQRMDASD
ncbi:MAG: sodium:solute symporter [Planctomycetota bacterium]